MAINPGSLASHQRWAAKNGFGFPICVDEAKRVASAYGALNPLGGVQRSVFLVDRQGVVRWARQGAPATAEILQAIDALEGEESS